MIELNKVLLAGRLTADPELRYLPSGAAVCDMRIASGRTYYDKNAGERKEETLFINATAWGQSAEFVSKYFNKGKAIFIEGRLKLDEWERDGQRHSRISVVAERVQFAEPKSAEAGRGGYSDGDEGDYGAGGGRGGDYGNRGGASGGRGGGGYSGGGGGGRRRESASAGGPPETEDDLPF